MVLPSLVQSDHSYIVLITCKKCGELDYLTSKAFSNLTDFGYKCHYCDTINRITLEGEGEETISPDEPDNPTPEIEEEEDDSEESESESEEEPDGTDSGIN
jgi:hypothetical protein